MPKNRAAVALRRIKSEARSEASRENGRKGGRPASYRRVKGELQKRHDDRWLTLEPPYDAAAKAYLRRI